MNLAAEGGALQSDAMGDASPADAPLLEAHFSRFPVSPRFALEEIGLQVRRGGITGILGPNGSGKSSLLKVLAGALPEKSRNEKVTSGASTSFSGPGASIRLAGRPLWGYPLKERARAIAFLPQDPLPPLDFTVEEIVGMGRFPHQDFFGQEREGDRAAKVVEGALRRLGLYPLRDRPIGTLSGGERQRTAIAKLLVQEAGLLLLDEPLASLDPGRQIGLLEELRKIAAEAGPDGKGRPALVLVLHDLNLAFRFCDQVLLMREGRPLALGPPAAALSLEAVEAAFGARAAFYPHPVWGIPQVTFIAG